jgi:hypothetical protein
VSISVGVFAACAHYAIANTMHSQTAAVR